MEERAGEECGVNREGAGTPGRGAGLRPVMHYMSDPPSQARFADLDPPGLAVAI